MNADSPALPPARASRFWGPATGLILIAAGLLCVGLVVLWSAAVAASKSGAGSTVYAERQLIYAAAACAAAGIAFKLDLEKLRRWIPHIFFTACALLVAVRIPGIGRSVKGSWRWIEVGPINIQVSDIAKFALILALSHYIAESKRFIGSGTEFAWFERRKKFPFFGFTQEARRDILRGYIFPCGIIGTICGLVVIEPDLGTTALCGAVGGILLFVSGARWRYLLPTALSVISVFAYVVANWENRMKRVTAFLDPEGTRTNEGYQLWQGMLAFACGGTQGEGLGNGMQQRYFLPEAHTDFVFSIIGEELGLLATGGVALAFLAFFWIVMWNLPRAQNLYQFNICLGACLFIVLQAAINIGVVTGLLPTKGMSLPFISYGGSNLVIIFIMLGLILNCLFQWSRPPAIRIKTFKP